MKLLFVLLALSISTEALSDEYVRGYIKKDGTYIQPYHRSESNSNKFDNYSTQGNSNPYTGKQGNVNPYAIPEFKSYQPPKNTYNNNLNN